MLHLVKKNKLYYDKFKLRPCSHYSIPRVFNLYRNVNMVKMVVRFNENCLYKIEGENSSDVNKLFGIVYDWTGVHENSIRIGWNSDGKMITLFAYYYFSGERRIEQIATTVPGIHVPLDIITLKDKNRFFIVGQHATGETFSIKRTMHYDKISTNNVFIAQPYFGGDEKPPHAMDIDLWYKLI